MQADRTSVEYQQWKQDVRQRDGNACRRCGFDTNLEVHHIKRWEKYPEFRTELDNGLTLCGNCHTLITGREETTDLLKFIEETPYSRAEQIVERLIAMMAEQLKALNDKFIELTLRQAEVPQESDDFTEPKHFQAEMLELDAEEKLREAKRLRREADEAVEKRRRENERKRQQETLKKCQRKAEEKRRRIAEEKRIATKQPINTFSHGTEVSAVAYSPNGDIIALGARDGTVKLWSIQNQREIVIFKRHKRQVSSVVFLSNGNTIASGAYDGTVKLWSIQNQHEIATFDVNLWQTEYDYLLRRELIGKQQEIAASEGHEAWVSSVAYSPNGDTIASGLRDGTVKLWSIQNREPIATFEGHKKEVASVVYSPNGDMIASRSWDGTVNLWSIQKLQKIATFEEFDPLVLSVAFSSNGDTIASGLQDGTVKLWSIQNREIITTFERHERAVLSVAFSSSGDTVASGSRDGTVKLWNTSPWFTAKR